MSVKILLLALISVLLVPFYSEAGIMLDKIMAIVNKEVITWSELYKTMEFEAPENVKAMKPEDKRKFFKENEHMFLENLIDARLQLQEAARSGMGVSEGDIDKAIAEIKSKYSLSDEKFREAIEKEGMPFKEYRRRLGEQILLGRIVEQEIRSKIVVSEKEIDDYIKNSKDPQGVTEGYDLSHIFFARSSGAMQKAESVYKMLSEGANFIEMAFKHSEDSSAKTGGYLGFIKKNEISPDFASVVSGMKKGDFSRPFQSGSGVHILRLNDKVEVKSQQDMRDVVKKKLLEQKSMKDYKDWTRSLREQAYIEVKD
ncbi:MAG: peptidylprolyl isomerase [Nitrospiraceae bacterium]|nr:peptidylprolyl isomerase [Nitrospiraceae bacterium]